MDGSVNGNEKVEQQGKRPTRVLEFRAGSRAFESHGYSHVKVTRDGVVDVLEIPIQSTGVAEVMDRLKRDEPIPPAQNVLVMPDSPAGKQLKLSERKWVLMPDFTDAGYIEKKRKHDTDMVLEVINQGVNVPFVSEDGKVVEDRDKRIDILRSMGISMPQFTQIANDIQDLTTLTDADRESFFVPRSGGAKTRQE